MKYYLFILLCLASIHSWSQQVTIAPGTNLVNHQANITLLNSSIKNDGNITGFTGSFTFSGSSDNTVYGNGTTSFQNVALEKSNGAKLILQKNIATSGTVLFTSGLLDLGNQQMELVYPNGILQNESENSRIIATGTGEVFMQLNLTAPNNVSPGNLGVFLSGSDNLGFTTIRRGHAPQLTNSQQQSIRRYFKIVPANNTGIYQQLRFTYFDAELNGQTEANLDLYEKKGGAEWAKLIINGTSTVNNFREIFGLTSLHSYTLFSGTAVPPDPGTITLSAPQTKTITGCYTQAQIDAAYVTWLNTVSATAACNVTIAHNSAGAPPACGGTVSVTFTASADCAPEAKATASFTVAPPVLQLICPTDFVVSAGSSPEQITTAFANWLKSATATGCNAVVQNSSDGIAPKCGNSVSVTFTAMDGCGQSTSCSASFSVLACSTQQGCTPGYWKNHTKAWGCNYTTKNKFFTVFSIISNKRGLSDKLTLQDALEMNAGGYNALVRHSVAALLNACHHAVDYPFTADEIKTAIVSMFNTGVATLHGVEYKGVEALKNALDAANNLGCPLNENSKSSAIESNKSRVIDIELEEPNTPIKITAYPNPFRDLVKFTIATMESGQARLEMFNTVGQKIGVVYTGYIQSGKPISIDYRMPAENSGTLIYVFRLNGKQESGKLVRVN